jgi:hypothetical protein
MVTVNGYATLAELEAIMGIDFSAKFIDAAGTIVAISDTQLEARGSLIEGFMIGLTHQTWTGTTIPTDCKSYFLRAWELDIELFLAKRNINFLPAPDTNWEDFLKSKFAEVIQDEIDEGSIADFDSAQDFGDGT